MSDPQRPTNRLAAETSPYLRQHAHNPVDWYPWGPEALARARELDRPIFLSIGYSACHWCHVMERESFEDEAIGQLLNDHFVSIKVDREERPDLDQIYMAFVQQSTGHGGWPMSVFLTPTGRPFFGGTYFPPDERYGGQMPSFSRVLHSVTEWWQRRRPDVEASAEAVTGQLQEALRLEPQLGELSPDLLRGAATQMARAFDRTHGGFGRQPKFPHAMDLRVLLRVWQRFGDANALHMARLTLDHMAMGGLYDQFGGGFHRYSTDERWLVPHFEKMLYDNALLTSAYVEGYQATGDAFYREVVEETLAYMRREMTSPEGPFYSTQDADSEGEEGKFYVWSAREIEAVLGAERAERFQYFYNITPEGNWEGHNIPHRSKRLDQAARLLRCDEAELRRELAESRRMLYEVRARRVWPGRDEKVLTSWNGLMIAALSQAAAAFDEPAHAEAASRAADFLLRRMRTADGRLLHTYGAGSEPKLNGYLEDYSYLIDGLVALYEATFEARWLTAASELAEVMIAEFGDPDEGGFWFTGRSHEALIARTKDPHDGSTPSGNSMAATALLRLAHLTGNEEYRRRAESALHLYRGLLERSPLAAGQMLLALDFYLGPVREYAVVGDPLAEDTRRVLRAVRGGFRPRKVVALRAPGQAAEVALLEGKESSGAVTLYVCENRTCEAPLVGAEAAETALCSPESGVRSP